MQRIAFRLPAVGVRSRPRVLRHAILVGLLMALLVVSRAPAVSLARAQTSVSGTRGWQHGVMRAPHLPTMGLQFVEAGPHGLVGTVLPSYRSWTSTDGLTWRLLPPPVFRPGEFPLGFKAAGRLLIMWGSTGFEPRIWASRDGAATWHESSAHFSIDGIGTGGDGAIAFSQSHVSEPVSVWTSADGLAWRQLPQRPGVFALAQGFSVARGPRGLVAGGAVVGPRPGMERAGIWTSPDGRVWSQVPNTNGILGPGRDGSVVNSVVAGPRGYLAIGQKNGIRQGVEWASPDGLHWQRRALPFSASWASFGQVTAWQGGFLAITNEGGETAIWSSTNGLAWTRMGSDELFGGSAQIQGVTGFRGGVAAVGRFAVHPQPACLRQPLGGLSDLRVFHPAAFLWRPTTGAMTPPPAIDRSDPRTLKLLASDLGGIVRASSASSSYVSLCGVDPALGPHRAYELWFSDPQGGTFTDTETSIVTASASASRAAFRSAGGLIDVGGDIQQRQELPAGVRIGEGTRIFRLRIRTDAEGSTNTYTKFAVAWRTDRVIGVVVAYHRHEAVLLAQRQFAHVKHP